MKTTPAVVRVFDRDRRRVTFSFTNTQKEALSGRLEFEPTNGVTIEPARPEFGPVAPGATAPVALTAAPGKPGPGRQTVCYRVIHTKDGRETRSAALPLTLMVGPTLEHVYEHPRPHYLVQTPRLTAKLDMFHGLCRYLADDDDTVRLNGAPLFTFSDGAKEMLFEGTTHAFTWPNEAPAHLTAHAYDRCRWQALFFGDRMLIRMDAGWTQFEKTHFTIPGRWVSPDGTPAWRRIVAVDDAGREFEAAVATRAANSEQRLPVAQRVRVAAALLGFPGGRWDLAFKFEPAQEVAINGTEMKFQIGSLTNDNWQIGFCKAEDFDTWRGKK